MSRPAGRYRNTCTPRLRSTEREKMHMHKDIIERLLYEEEDDKKRLAAIRSFDDEDLYVYAYNYNWDDGFDEPRAIAENPDCSLSTALLLFERAEGFEAIEDEGDDEYMQPWRDFGRYMYDRLIHRDFKEPKIRYGTPGAADDISPDDPERVFYEYFDGKDCDIDL